MTLTTHNPSPITIETPRGTIEGLLDAIEGARGAIVMVGGAGGGLQGPAGIYGELARRLSEDNIASIRVDYRIPNNIQECIYDVLAAIAALNHHGIDRFVLLGWSFGGAIVISAGAASEMVVGVATIASQTYGADTVEELSPRSLLLIHGTGDTVLPDNCSRYLFKRAGEPKQIVLYEKDDHAITRNASDMLEKLREWTRDLINSRSQVDAEAAV
jgi:dienelactone hydrolase